LYEDSTGQLWVAAGSGVWRWKPGPPKLFPLRDIEGGLQTLAEDERGMLLIVTGSGIKQLVNGKISEYSLPAIYSHFQPNTLLRDRDGGLWIGTHDRGLLHKHGSRMDVLGRSDGLSSDDVLKLFEDREGNIWVSTKDGLDRFREFVVATFSESQGLALPSFASILEGSNGSVWVNSSRSVNLWGNGQVALYQKQQDRSILPKSQQNVHVITDSGLPDSTNGSMFRDHSGRIWIGSTQGVGYLENDRFTTISALPGGYVNFITGDARGNLWIVNQNVGLFHKLPDDTVQKIPWSSLGHKDPAFRLAVDPLKGGLWLGFFNGGVAYFADGQIRRSFAATDGLGRGTVNDLRVGPDGTLWAATEGGLSRLKNDRVITLTRNNGLPCDSVDWLLDDDDSFWLYTLCGLVRIPRSELDAWSAAAEKDGNANYLVRATVFDSSDGVRSTNGVSSFSPRAVRSTDGKLWFGVPDGVSVLDPRHLRFNSVPPPVHIERVVADRKTYELADIKGSVHLAPRLRDLQIDYTALSFAAPEKMRFLYKLEGRDTDWQDAGARRQVFYNDLSPRNYRFRVKASNNSGVWNETGAFLDFIVDPAYYQTTWFVWLCVMSLLVLLGASLRFRRHQVVRQFNMRLEERVRERTRIARELHDTLLQSFQGVLLRFHTVTYLLPDRPDEARSTLEGVIEQARQAITEGRDAVQGLRPPTVVNDLGRAIRIFGEELAANQAGEDRPEFRVHAQGPPQTLAPAPRDETYWIAVEALRNAFKHSHARRIEVEIEYDRRQFQLRVRDDGKGIDPTVLNGHGRDGHFGLTGMHERAESVGAELGVWTKLDAGTEVELTIPGRIAYAKNPAATPLPSSKGNRSQS
jgi:signal transduction histidine kinase/ligand-binding sensor domain-containing protein